jgi:hypothetical protein
MGEEDDKHNAEAELSMFIQRLCQRGILFAKRLTDPNEDRAEQYRHYASIRDKCLKGLNQIQDEFYRGFATHRIIDLCMTAGEQDRANATLCRGSRSIFAEANHWDEPSPKKRFVGFTQLINPSSWTVPFGRSLRGVWRRLQAGGMVHSKSCTQTLLRRIAN